MTFEKNVFSGVPVCHEKMRTGIWVTWTRIVGGGGGGGRGEGLEESFASKRTCHFLLPNAHVQSQVSLMTERLGIGWKGLIRFRFCRRSLKSTCCYTRKKERLQFWRLLF